MLKKDVKLGHYYAIKHTNTGNLSVVRLDTDCQYGGYYATKLSTNRRIRIKSAAKLRAEVVINPEWTAGKSKRKWVKA
jgi:hypothetical protein